MLWRAWRKVAPFHPDKGEVLAVAKTSAGRVPARYGHTADEPLGHSVHERSRRGDSGFSRERAGATSRTDRSASLETRDRAVKRVSCSGHSLSVKRALTDVKEVGPTAGGHSFPLGARAPLNTQCLLRHHLTDGT